MVLKQSNNVLLIHTKLPHVYHTKRKIYDLIGMKEEESGRIKRGLQ